MQPHSKHSSSSKRIPRGLGYHQQSIRLHDANLEALVLCGQYQPPDDLLTLVVCWPSPRQALTLSLGVIDDEVEAFVCKGIGVHRQMPSTELHHLLHTCTLVESAQAAVNRPVAVYGSPSCRLLQRHVTVPLHGCLLSASPAQLSSPQ